MIVVILTLCSCDVKKYYKVPKVKPGKWLSVNTFIVT